MNNNLVSLNLNSTKNSTLQKNSTVSSNIVNLNLLDVAYTQGTKSNFQSDLNNLDLMEEEYTFEELMEYADKQLENMKATARIENVINNIGDIDPNDIDDIQRALSMYNSLTDEQKRSMSSEVKTKLENAIKDYNESVNKASEVIDAINNIGEIDFNSKEKIDEVLNLYNSLTDGQKSFLSPEVVEMINSLEQVSKQIEDTQSKISELENLYNEREENNGFWHPIKESEIEERIKELEKELGVSHQPDEWERIWDEPGAALATFGVSVLEGFIDLGEGLVDGTIYSIAKPLQLFGVDDKWAEDIISYDVSGNMYDSFVDAAGIAPEIAYGMMHSAGNFVGEMVGYYALSAVPYAGPALCAVAGAGSAVEDSINRQLEDSGTVNDWVVFGESALGALEGFGFGKAGKAAHQGINALKELGTSGAKELIKSQTQNLSKETIKQILKEQGKNIVKKTAIDTLKDSDTWMETGAVVIDNVVTGMETGEWNFGRMAGETAVVLGENFIGNLGGNYLNYDKTVRYKQDFNSNMHSLDDIERSKAWEDYFKEAYGADNVAKTSGIDIEGHNGVFIDPNASNYNKSIVLDKAKEISGWIDITEPKALIWNYDSATGKMSVNVDWPKYGGMDSDKIISFLDYEGDIITLDRVGSEFGGTYSIIPSDGMPESMSRRAIFNNPDTYQYRTMTLDKTKYITYCDGADEIVQYVKTKGSIAEAIDDPFVIARVERLTTDLGMELTEANVQKVNSAIFGEYGSYLADIEGSHIREDIVSIEKDLGISSKYGYSGNASEWVTPDGEVIASGGAAQFNLRASEQTLNNLGIMKSSEPILLRDSGVLLN